ncbi:hypothetical protein, variant [Phytophthora nicotianae]|uniref:Uncharacterized protein n=1 Tax=Phytophthora nicotianae TaxID=4792 RepID=W2IPB8_PHYNI|nr:hypothetical protein L916_12481 [Phytophthora nicotianae]ETL35377.1 hypothetical protein, variant [Phytophthora nicotianae]
MKEPSNRVYAVLYLGLERRVGKKCSAIPILIVNFKRVLLALAAFIASRTR